MAVLVFAGLSLPARRLTLSIRLIGKRRLGSWGRSASAWAPVVAALIAVVGHRVEELAKKHAVQRREATDDCWRNHASMISPPSRSCKLPGQTDDAAAGPSAIGSRKPTKGRISTRRCRACGEPS